MGTPDDLPPSVAIVEAVADAADEHPDDLRPRLAAVIDPDALDGLFRDRSGALSRTDGRVRLRYCGHDVVVDAAGRVAVDDPPAGTVGGPGDRGVAPGQGDGDDSAG